MSQSIPVAYIPPGNHRENFFEWSNLGHPGKFSCPIPHPGAKLMVEFPGVLQNYPKHEEIAPETLTCKKTDKSYDMESPRQNNLFV